MIRPKEIPRILKQGANAVMCGWHIRLIASDGKSYDCRWSEYQQALEKMRNKGVRQFGGLLAGLERKERAS